LAPPSCPTVHPRHPTSSLFPYTTLFRSLTIPTTFSSAHYPLHNQQLKHQTVHPLQIAQSLFSQYLYHTLYLGIFHQPSCAKSYIDRKSTRLNSSHVSISYAVFCLKKKS